VKLLRKRPQPHAYRAKAASRMATLPTGDVLDWADAYAAEVWKGLEDYRKGVPVALDEIERGLQCLLGIVDDLRRRDESDK